MPATAIAVRRRWPAALLVLAGLLALPARAAAIDEAAPTFTADSCCELCPRAADPAVYVTQFLRDHQTLIAGSEQWLFRSNIDLMTAYTIDEAVLADLGRMVRALNRRGTEVLLFDFPPRGILHADRLLPGDRAGFDAVAALASYRAMLQRFRDIGFIVPDYGRFADQPDGGDYYFRRDGHWTPDGARRTAALMADTIAGLPMAGTLRHRPYATRSNGANRHPGVLSIAAMQLCGGQYPSEVVPGYVTDALKVDPFGDEPAPEIALVGTSFSATPTYHFAGFLEQALQASVLNLSLPGGNFDGAMTQYLLSDAFRSQPPRLLIWEFGHPQIAVANHGQMRRLVPLVDNGCVARTALISGEASLASGDDYASLLYNGGGQILRVPSRELVVDLQFGDPAVIEFLAESWYLDGKHEVLRVRLNDFTRSKGRFVIELDRSPDFADQPLIAFRVQIVTPIAAATKVSARLCRADEPPGSAESGR